MKKLQFKLGSFCVLLLFICACEVKKQDIHELQEDYNGPKIFSKNVHTVFSDSAKKAMVMDAKEQVFLQNDDQEYPKGIFVTFYDDDEKVRSTIAADYAYFIKITNVWRLKGNVDVKNVEKEQRLETQEMIWKPRSGDIIVEDKDSVKITEPTQVLWGDGLVAKDDFSYYKIKNPRGFKLQ